MPKISVIIPVYNTENYLKRCLNSIINQTFDDIEIICVNDFSTDNSIGILKEFSQKDERIKVINNTQNIGSALARNKGIDIAQGQYIYFIDADDYIEPDYLELMFNTIEKQNCDIVLNLAIVTESNGVQSPYKHPSLPEIPQNGEYFDKYKIIETAPVFIWARLYKKSLFDKYNIRFIDIHSDDVAFNTVVNIFSDKTFVFYGKNYYYTVNNTGLTGKVETLNNKDFEHIKAHNVIYDYLKEHNMLDDKLKLFRVYPFIKVDTEEKFEYYKNFFEKIKADFHKNEDIYNELEKYFAYSLLNSLNYEEYLKNYNKVVTIGFLRRGKK